MRASVSQLPAVAPRRGLILAVLGTCFLVVMMDNTILNVALQTIQVDLGATNSELQWAVDAYILVYAALMFSAGVLADSFGRRRVLVAGLGIFAVASALSAFSQSPGELILWRAVMGLGGAVVPPTTLAIIRDVFPREEHAKAMGVWAALGGLSVAFGPIIGGALLEGFAWGSVFLINVPIVAVCVLLILRAVPESRAERRPRLDVGGVALSMIGTVALVYGVIHGGQTSDWLSLGAAGAIAGGLAVLVALVFYERGREDPALDVSLFRSAPFTAGTISISLSFFALTGGTFLLVFYVQLVLGYTPLQLGLVLLPVAVGSVAAAVSSAALAARRGPRFAVVAGLLFLLVSFVGLAFIDGGTPLAALEVALLAAGIGMGLVMGTTTPLVMSVVDEQKSGVGAAVNNTLRQIGAALGVAVIGSVYSVSYQAQIGSLLDPLTPPLPPQAGDSLGGTVLALERVQAPPAVLEQARDAFVASMHTTVLVAIGVLAVGALLAQLWLPRRSPAAAAQPSPAPVRPPALHGGREAVER
jgi:EmrB/QacA subfamily drug resistance transporter